MKLLFQLPYRWYQLKKWTIWFIKQHNWFVYFWFLEGWIPTEIVLCGTLKIKQEVSIEFSMDVIPLELEFDNEELNTLTWKIHYERISKDIPFFKIKSNF